LRRTGSARFAVGPAPASARGHAHLTAKRRGQRPSASASSRSALQFATYEEFAAAFRELGTFAARDTPGSSPTGFQVLGDGTATTGRRPPTMPRCLGNAVSRENNTSITPRPLGWKRIFPPELGMAVYEIPADCADVAILLRHVWLSARGRTERYGSWIGTGAGRTQKQRATHLTSIIRDRVFSGSVQAIVGSAYHTEGGEPLRSAAVSVQMVPSTAPQWWTRSASPSVTTGAASLKQGDCKITLRIS